MIEKYHSSRIPVILESKTIKLNKDKFLSPDNITVAIFLKEIRNHLVSISDHTAYYLITSDGKMLTPTDEMSLVQIRHREECGFLFLRVEKENLYG